MSEKTSNKNKIVIGILLLVIATLGYQLYNRNTTITDLSGEKELLISQLEGYKADLMSQTTANDSLNAHIADETARLNALIVKAQSINASNSKELSALRNQVLGYRKQIDQLTSSVDSVNKVYAVLQGEKAKVDAQFADEQSKNDLLTSDNAKLTADVAEGARLKLAGVEGGAYNVNKAGTEKETQSSGRTKRFKACFTLAANALSHKGEHTVYLRVNGPGSRVLGSTGDNRTMNIDGKEVLFTSKQSVQFNGDMTQACCSADMTSSLEKGTYVLELFSDGRKLGEAKVVLN